jgi:gliding motility-associated-like protein
MYIFNRWGAVLFSSNEPNPKWDGRFKDQDAATGVYVYMVRGFCNNHVPFFKYGDVTLIR